MNSHDKGAKASGSFAPRGEARYLTLLAAVADVQTSLDTIDRRSEELLVLVRRLVQDVEGERFLGRFET